MIDLSAMILTGIWYTEKSLWRPPEASLIIRHSLSHLFVLAVEQ
jgi:hypothetical protein